MDSFNQAKIVEVTRQLEHGDALGLTQLLSGKFEEERIQALNLIRDQNTRDRKADSHLPELQIETGSMIPGNYERVTLDNGSFHDSFWGGKLLYDSNLDMSTLTRTGTAEEAVPSNRSEVDVRALTTKLEQGDGQGVKQLLSPLYEEERFRVFDQVQKLNQLDLQQHKTNVTLDISKGSAKGGEDFLYVNRTLPGYHDSFFGGAMLYRENLDLHTLQRSSYEYQDNRKS